MHKFLGKLFGAAMLLLPALAAAQARPANVPAEYQITPFGYFHPSCVVHLAKGDELRPAEKLVRHADGTANTMQVCAYPHYRADGEAVFADERASRNPDISHAWVENVSTTSTTSYGGISAKWSVPAAPTTNDNQTLYYFPGLEDLQNVVTILQPVLGWNSDYASAWGIASWNCCENGTTYEATPAPVNSGDTIVGTITNTCPAGTLTCGSWNVVTWDLQNGGISQLLDTGNYGQTFDWAFGGALEVYGIVQCGDYPSTGGAYGGNAMSFNDIALYTNQFAQIAAPKWKISAASKKLSPQCSYGASLPTQIILDY